MSNNPQIPGADFPLATPGATDTVLGVDESSRALRRFRRDSFPLSAADQARLQALEVGQSSDMIGFTTKALMDASLAHPANTLAVVTNDATATNNGTYIKLGASGAGNWQLSADRVTSVESDLSGYRRAGRPVVPVAPVGFRWALVDEAGNAAFAVKDDGTVVAASAEIAELFAVALSLQELTVAGITAALSVYPGYSLAFCDSNGGVAFGVTADGTLKVHSIEVAKVNGQSPGNRHGGVYSHQINFINSTGQSLGEGSNGSVTTSKEYDNIGFPAHASEPVAFVDLTVSATQLASRGESPMYGALGHIKELIAEENGLSWQANDYQLATCNNAYSGYSITQLNKGQAPYTVALSQMTAGKSIADAQGKTFAVQAVLWTQGEADSAMSTATYKGHLKQLAADYSSDAKFITGQAHDVLTICCQTGSTTANRNVAIAQMEAADESPLILIACPMYQFTYYDAQHIDAASSKWLGGYYGLAYKRAVIDRKDWQPLKPVQHAVLGNVIDLFFNKDGLALDTTVVPAQASYGFSLVDGGGSAVSISSVSVIAPNRVRITCAASPVSGWAVRYGFGAATGRSDPYLGGCGNLRDSQGEAVTYNGKPMHNWCVIFSYTI